MQFVLDIISDDDAFAIDTPGELGRILIELGEAITSGRMPGSVRDIDGNTVGSVSYTA